MTGHPSMFLRSTSRAVGGDKNSTALCLVGGVFVLIGGFIILTKVKAVR